MKKNTLRILTSVMATTILLNGCGLMKKADANNDTTIEMQKENQDYEDKTVTENQTEWSEEVTKSKDEPENEPENMPEQEDATPAETSDSADNESSESASLEATDSSELPEVGKEYSFRGWTSNQIGDESYYYFSFDESDYDLNFDHMISLENMTSEQQEYIKANIYEEFEISFIYAEDMGEYDIYSVEPVSIKVVPEDASAAASYSADTDPLRGLVADDILDKYRATNPVKHPDSIRDEAKRLGHWVQKTLARDGFPEEIKEMGDHIGYANEYAYGTDISNNFDNNFPYYYVDYFVLKDYYTSEGARCTEFYENLIEANEALGDGDPKSIDQLYEDLKEFITACNNIIRSK
ncbi:hypothetical protein [Butyrivibrio sp. XPD2002]|uniref:hypothetical protein n=1 Tax=Butyrivibrio sp. XPD2002 TaxID=1280665 RepID=UPI0004235253|nr:hypothetical protein [Butyrivibrio sp. XPD2002]